MVLVRGPAWLGTSAPWLLHVMRLWLLHVMRPWLLHAMRLWLCWQQLTQAAQQHIFLPFARAATILLLLLLLLLLLWCLARWQCHGPVGKDCTGHT
jgi:cell division protein FtsX